MKKKSSTKYILVLAVTIFLTLNVKAQFQKIRTIGPELNIYPAGIMIGCQYERSLKVGAFNIRAAANITRRKNFSGLNDDERGGGGGFGLGYRYYFKPEMSGLYLGARTDLWGMKINWKDSLDIEKHGITNIMVVQPTIEVGYIFHINQNWQLGVALTNGVEINVVTDGAEVGQGWITLAQFRIEKKIFRNITITPFF